MDRAITSPATDNFRPGRRATLVGMTIEPDTKDWTWVLDRPCPECGYDASAVAATEVADAVRRNAASWAAALRSPGSGRRPDPSVWSPLEYGCHVRDVFRLYDQQDPAVVAPELRDAAAAIADRFDGVTGDQWQRRGRRSDGASFTVDSFARYFLHDVVHHLHDVGR